MYSKKQSLCNFHLSFSQFQRLYFLIQNQNTWFQNTWFSCATLRVRGDLSDAFTSVMPGARTSKHVNGLAKMTARMKSGLFQAFQQIWSPKSQ